jgi:hypothetical protein
VFIKSYSMSLRLSWPSSGHIFSISLIIASRVVGVHVNGSDKIVSPQTFILIWVRPSQ